MNRPTDPAEPRQAATTTITYVCPECDGRCEKAGELCLACGARGVVKRCSNCDGTGAVFEIGTEFRASCPDCSGRAYVLLTTTIPPKKQEPA